MKELLNEIKAQENCTKYTSWQGKTCYRTSGSFNWYNLKCYEYGLEPKWIGDFHYSAKGKGFTFEYCEHSIIYVID